MVEMEVVNTVILVFGSGMCFIAGAIIMSNLNLKNYFKKLRFKSEIEMLKKENSLKIKQLEKSMGITAEKESVGNIGPWLGMLQKLKPEQIQSLLGMVGGEEDEGGFLEGLLGNEQVQEFLTGMLQGAAENKELQQTETSNAY